MLGRSKRKIWPTGTRVSVSGTKHYNGTYAVDGRKPLRWYLLRALGEWERFYYPCLNTMCAIGWNWYGKPSQFDNYNIWHWMLTRAEMRRAFVRVEEHGRRGDYDWRRDQGS